MSGASKQVSGPVLTSQILAVLPLCEQVEVASSKSVFHLNKSYNQDDANARIEIQLDRCSTITPSSTLSWEPPDESEPIEYEEEEEDHEAAAGGGGGRGGGEDGEAHVGIKLGHFETSKIHFPTSEGVSEVSEVSERANE